jgi:hypothetical protein
MSSKESLSTLMGSAIAGSGDLQAPHRPVSARWLAETRFFFPQFGQERITGLFSNFLEVSAQHYFSHHRGLRAETFR